MLRSQTQQGKMIFKRKECLGFHKSLGSTTPEGDKGASHVCIQKCSSRSRNARNLIIIHIDHVWGAGELGFTGKWDRGSKGRVKNQEVLEEEALVEDIEALLRAWILL